MIRNELLKSRNFVIVKGESIIDVYCLQGEVQVYLAFI